MLTGTCASGKSSVSSELSERFGFTQIDGDWILALMKQELGRKLSATEVHDTLLVMAYGMVAIGRSVTVAHVVLPEHFGLYTSFLGQRGFPHRIVVLMPSESVVLARNLQRRCWPKATPEYWVRKFRQDFLDAGESALPHFYDNSAETADETADETAANLAGASIAVASCGTLA